MKLLFINYIFHNDTHGIAMWFLVVGLMALIPNIASLFDLKTGINASKRLGQFKTTSFGLRETIKKDKDYMIYFVLMMLIDSCLSFFIDIPILCIVCAIAETAIELYSVRENMAKGRSKEETPADPLGMMQQLVSVLGQDKAQQVFNILTTKQDESK
ncbi:hypothetical protein [uncultured Bacteroides sp.]|uniref:hypothetical protein n=1 Tax=uncultured Bacteroides sp. TaxID=162156 RepID=UPI002AABD49D|nr:hypothetical protein [uncultured Bacteroides sp.]